MRRQAITSLRASAVALACAALLAGCGGGGDDESASQAQLIDFPYPGVRYLATTPEALNATTTSGLPVTFSSNTPAVCQISDDGRLVPVAVGECSVTASQPGNGEYIAAAPAQQLFTILRQPQTITFPSRGFQDINVVPAPLVVSASSGLSVQLASATPQVCGVNGMDLLLLSHGDCTIVALQAGTSDFDAAPPVSITFGVGDTPPPVLTLLSNYSSAFVYGGSSKADGWWCYSQNPAWCSTTVSADGTSITSGYRLQSAGDLNAGAYAGLEQVVEGVGSISNTANTTTGAQVDKQKTLKFALGQNAEWFATGTADNSTDRNVRVVLVLGHFNIKNDGNACNVALSASFKPGTAAVQPYQMQLQSFTAIQDSCDLSNLNAAAELLAYPIVKVKFEAARANVSVARTTDPGPNGPIFPTEITLTGPVTVE